MTSAQASDQPETVRSLADDEPVALAVDIKFPVQILFAGDVTGMSIDVAVAGVRGTLKFPEQSLGRCGHCVSLQSPRVAGEQVPAKVVRLWGNPAVWQVNPLQAAWIHAAVVEIAGPFTELKRLSTEVSQAIVLWEQRLLAWLESLSSRLLVKLAHQREQVVTAKRVWRVHPAEKYEVAQGGSNGVHVTMPKFRPVQRMEVQRACQRASEGRDVPVEYELLRAARTFAHRGNARGALIEFASALEVACGTWGRTVGGRAGDEMSCSHGLHRKVSVLVNHGFAMHETEREAVEALR